MEHRPKKVAGNKWSQPKTEAMCAANKALGVGLPKPIGAYITIPHALDAEHGVTGFSVCPAGFQSYLIQSFLVSQCLFCTTMEVCNFFFFFFLVELGF
jgi:hypothetical protein